MSRAAHMPRAIRRAGAACVLLLFAGVLRVGGTTVSAMQREDNRFCVRAVEHSPVLGNGPAVELRVRSPRPFPVRALLPELRIGSQRFLLGRYPPDGDSHALIFTLTPEEFARLRDGEPVTVRYGGGQAPAGWTWTFGPLEKTRACTD